MIEALISMAAYAAVALILVIWMAIRVARSSPLLAVLVFLFSPAALIALVRYWGDRDSDIRLPFALTVLTFGLMMFMAYRAVDQTVLEAAPYFSDEEIEFVRQDNPKLAVAIEVARAKAYAEHGEAYFANGGHDDDAFHYGDEDAAAGRAAPIAAPRLTAMERAARAAATKPAAVEVERAEPPPPPDPADLEASRLAELRVVATALSYRFGTVSLAPAPAELTMPRGFRFAPRQTVLRVAKLRGIDVPSDLLGWLVHQKVDLAAPDAWFVEVRYVPSGADAGPGVELRHLLAAAGGSGALGVGPYAPGWSTTREVATWARQREAGDAQIDLHAARPLRTGVLLYAVRQLHGGQEELGLRATRLMARRTVPVR
jgi:hypothetical protein